MSDPQFGDTFAYDDFDLIQTSDETQSDKSDDDNLNTTDTTTNMHQKKEDQNSVKSTKKELELTKTDNFEFIITFEKDIFPIELPKTSTIKDLKLAISRTLHILPEHQQIDGFNIPWENLSDELPLSKLNINPSHSLLLRKYQPVFGPKPRKRNVPLSSQFNKQIQIDPYNTMPLVVPPHKFHEQVLGESEYDIEEYVALWDASSVNIDHFTQNFENEFGTVHPIFTGGPYSETANLIKETFQLLIVNLHGDNKRYPQNVLFCKETLTSETLAQFLAENFIFWVGEVDLEKELEFQGLFGYPVQFPFLAIVAYLNNRMTIIDLYQGRTFTSEELITKLSQIVEIYNPILQKNKEQELERKMKQLIIEEQNAEYQKALQQDREKAKQKLESAKIKEEKINRATSIIREARLKAIKKFESLPPEPRVGETSTTIQIRLPNGSRVQRKFSPSHTLQLVVDFIEGYVAQVLDDTSFIDDATSSLEDENVIPWSIRSYELINNFPKRKFTNEDFDKTLQQLGLVPQVLLYLQEKIPSNN